MSQLSRKSTFCSERLVCFNLAADMSCLQFLPAAKNENIGFDVFKKLLHCGV